MDGYHIPESLQSLIDHHSIEQVLKKYARALDDKNYDLLDACFTADAELDFTEAGGVAGRYPEVKRWLEKVLAPIVEMQHFITNVEVFFDGAGANTRTYTLNVNGIQDATGNVQHMVVGAVYFDQFVRVEGLWRISRRRETRLCTMGKKFGPA